MTVRDVRGIRFAAADYVWSRCWPAMESEAGGGGLRVVERLGDTC